MEHLSQINPFQEGRKPPSRQDRKQIARQRQKQKKEAKAQQLRELYLMGETHPQKILSDNRFSIKRLDSQ